MKGSIKLQLPVAKATNPVVKQAQLLLFGDISEWDDGVSARAVIQQLETLQADELLVRINSYGGHVHEGVPIYNAIRGFKGKVITRIEGVAASIAGVIAMAGHTVEMAFGTSFMIHRAWNFAQGDYDDFAVVMEGLQRADKMQAECFARKTGRTAEEEFALITSTKERWFTPEEAIAAGYVDSIYDSSAPDQPLQDQVARAAWAYYKPSDAAYSGAFASAIKPRLTASPASPKSAAARAASPTPPKETRMNYTALAKALGITLADGADEAAAKSAVLQYLGLPADASDSDVAIALATRDAGEDSTEVTPASAQGRHNPANARHNGNGAGAGSAQITPIQARSRDVGELFDIAMAGRTDRAELLAMRAKAILSDDPLTDVKQQLSTYLAGGVSVRTVYTQHGDGPREKQRAAASLWIMARAGAIKPGSKEADGLNGNPFRGMSLNDIARWCIEESGDYRRSMNRYDIIKAAVTSSTSDFQNIYENALNKLLLDGFALQQPTWPQFCKVGTLTDFRPHIRYSAGSIGDLEVRQENGEFKTLHFTDAERESITAQNRGGVIDVTYEMLINDDMGVFTDVSRKMGQSAARTLEKAVYALFTLNGGLGPVMGDGNTLFHASHGNIAATAARPTVASIEAARILMASQLDVSGNDYLDIRPDRFLGPLSVGGEARVVNNSTYDPDATGKLQRANIVGNLFTGGIIDSPRLSGNAWYMLADPNLAPVIEVGFLDGQQEPQFAQEEAFSQDGMRWRVKYPFGVGAVGFRGIVMNAGTA